MGSTLLATLLERVKHLGAKVIGEELGDERLYVVVLVLLKLDNRRKALRGGSVQRRNVARL